MGLIYKVGNTIQGLPFPGKNLFSTSTSTAIALFISLLLLVIQWPVSFTSHSVSLSVLATLQIIITSFLGLFLLLGSFENRIKLQKFRFIYFFLGGFFISLGCGYLFLDAFALINNPLLQLGDGIWAVSLATLFGNILIVQVLSKAKVIPFKVKVLQIPFFSIIIFSLVNIVGLVLMVGMNSGQLDPLLGLLEAVAVCLWGVVTSLDAYWKMVELEKVSAI
ncbi:MAG: hypothetical protein KTR30_29745 [Saprospiraceae bacterium]|nr:hypothetical protein [Saprospiraceae bacterium]